VPVQQTIRDAATADVRNNRLERESIM